MEVVEKRSNSGHRLKVELTRVKENSKIWGLSKWKGGVAYWDGEVCGRTSEL